MLYPSLKDMNGAIKTASFIHILKKRVKLLIDKFYNLGRRLLYQNVMKY